MVSFAVNKIFIVQIGKIGDLLLTLPLIKILRNNYPDSEISLLINNKNRSLSKVINYTNNILFYNKNPIKLIKLFGDIRKLKNDLWIDPKDHFSSESHYLAKFSKAKYKIGFNGEKNIFDESIPSDIQNYNLSALERNLNIFDILKVDKKLSSFKSLLKIPEDAQRNFNIFKEKAGIINFFAINISATSVQRYWPVKNWISLVNLINELKIPIILIGLAKDADIIKQIISCAGSLFYYETKEITDVIPVINDSAIVITPDTSIVHLAGILNKPVLALYANNERNFNKFKPFSDDYEAVIMENSGAEVRDIPVESVANAFKRLYNKYLNK